MWKKVRRPQEEKSRYIKRLKKCWIYKENQDMKKLVSTDFSAENWLILGKKWSMMIATADKYGCRTLPMRNWHGSVLPGVSDILGFSKIRRTLPMRNWHSSSVFLSITYFMVGHYLWGIDTLHQGFYPLQLLQHPVGHYLWGIDTGKHLQWECIS